MATESSVDFLVGIGNDHLSKGREETRDVYKLFHFASARKAYDAARSFSDDPSLDENLNAAGTEIADVLARMNRSVDGGSITFNPDRVARAAWGVSAAMPGLLQAFTHQYESVKGAESDLILSAMYDRKEWTKAERFLKKAIDSGTKIVRYHQSYPHMTHLASAVPDFSGDVPWADRPAELDRRLRDITGKVNSLQGTLDTLYLIHDQYHK